jgi:hypothetical protein
MKIARSKPCIWSKTDTQGRRRRQILACKGSYEKAASFCRYLMYRAIDSKTKKNARADYQYFEGKCRLGKK